MFQQVLISILFLGAAFYVGRLAYRSFQAKNACQSGCGKCGALDLKKIEKKLQKL
ncbi:MAG: FeoB-associated Cys-rich membrane protein [Cyclobacteriaceae bacterium]|jgi:hypothetical protein|nr:FeoB-associated Cys-rich membrane protein [Cyclobacteriaceae bacterium]